MRGILDQIGILKSDLQQITSPPRKSRCRRASVVAAGLQQLDRRMSTALGVASKLILRRRRQDSCGDDRDHASRAAVASAAEEASAASREAATAANEQSRGAEDLAAAIEEIASLAEAMRQAYAPDRNVQPQRHPHSGRFLTFRVGGQLYALRSEDVLEVIRMPAVARVPQSPPALLGIGNLRGAVLPVVGLRELLGQQRRADGRAPARSSSISARRSPFWSMPWRRSNTSAEEQIDTDPKESARRRLERLLGAFPSGPSKEVAKILDIKGLLESGFFQLCGRARAGNARPSAKLRRPAQGRDAAARRSRRRS